MLLPLSFQYPISYCSKQTPRKIQMVEIGKRVLQDGCNAIKRPSIAGLTDEMQLQYVQNMYNYNYS